MTGPTRSDTLWYYKLKWNEWLQDGGLRRVSFAARGLWVDLLAYMHTDAEIGFLTIKGRAATNGDIAKMIGAETRQVNRLLAELEDNDVLSRDDRGAVFDRKMRENYRKSREFSAYGQQGGNPLLNEISELTGKRVKGRLKAGLKPLYIVQEERKKVRVPEATLQGADAPQETLDKGLDLGEPVPREPPVEPQPEPQPTSQPQRTPKDILFQDGLPLLAELTNRDVKANRVPLAKLLGKMRQAAGDNDVLLMDVLTRCRDQKPAEPISWIKGCLTLAKVETYPRLAINNVVDPQDPYGILAWCPSVTGAKPSGPEDCGYGAWCAYGYIIDRVALNVVEAMELPPGRVDWHLLEAWLSEGIDPEAITKRIASRVEWLRGRPDRTPARSLQAVDSAVRGDVRRAV